METVDGEVWDKALAIVTSEFAALSTEDVTIVREVCANIKAVKLALYLSSINPDERRMCEICRGACCQTGKYHLTVVELLTYLCDGKAFLNPDFSNGRCPYLGDNGCMMGPEYRPFNCITFHCDNVEELLDEWKLRDVYTLEKELRLLYKGMEKMFNNRFLCGLFANYERAANNGKMLFMSADDV